MGCVESVPVAEIDLNRAHQVDPSIPVLGGLPPSDQRQDVLVAEKLFSFSGDDFKIKRMDGSPFWGIRIKGKAFALRDQMALLDSNGAPIAVCLRKFGIGVETFKIYTVTPLYAGQSPSSHDYQGKRLYTYAEVTRVMMSPHHEVRFDNEPSPSFSVLKTGFFPKTRVVKLHGIVAGTINGGTWGGSVNTYRISACPGIDPCLLICISAICDEMEED